jgi:hypothetical protein
MYALQFPSIDAEGVAGGRVCGFDDLGKSFDTDSSHLMTITFQANSAANYIDSFLAQIYTK